jgi:6-phosphogluconolactonase
LRFSLYRFEEEGAWIGRIVLDFTGAVEAAIGRRQAVFHASLAGGNTPEPAYRALAAAPSLAALSGKIRIHLWVGDEREVPADSPLRNGAMITSVFGEGAAPAASPIAGTPSSAEWKLSFLLHLWPEGDREKACAAYAGEIEKTIGEKPAFDLAVLGMGADGHTAGLFSLADTMAESLAIATEAPSHPVSRMTMGAALLKRSRQTMVLVRGREKKATLDEVLKNDRFPLNLAAGSPATIYYLET